MSKVFEQIITHRLVSYFDHNGFFRPEQHDYRKGHATASGLLQVVNSTYKTFVEGKHAELNLLDLSKAFDSVSHDILIYKLEYYGVRGQPLNLLKSYLTDRQQLMEWNNTSSELMTISHGVPARVNIGSSVIYDLCQRPPI